MNKNKIIKKLPTISEIITIIGFIVFSLPIIYISFNVIWQITLSVTNLQCDDCLDYMFIPVLMAIFFTPLIEFIFIAGITKGNSKAFNLLLQPFIFTWIFYISIIIRTIATTIDLTSNLVIHLLIYSLYFFVIKNLLIWTKD